MNQLADAAQRTVVAGRVFLRVSGVFPGANVGYQIFHRRYRASVLFPKRVNPLMVPGVGPRAAINGFPAANPVGLFEAVGAELPQFVLFEFGPGRDRKAVMFPGAPPTGPAP